MITKIGLYNDPRKKKPWVVRWYGEYDPTTGKQKRYSKSFKLKRDAEAFQSQQIVGFKEGQQRDKPEEITLKTFCDDWLKTRANELKPGTLELYRDTMKRLYDFFGQNYMLSKLTPRSAAKFIGELRRIDIPKNGQKLSNWTRHRILRNCKTIFGYAVTWQLLHTNPFQDVKAPKLVTIRWHYLKADEYLRLLEVAPSLRLKACYALAYIAGL